MEKGGKSMLAEQAVKLSPIGALEDLLISLIPQLLGNEISKIHIPHGATCQKCNKPADLSLTLYNFQKQEYETEKKPPSFSQNVICHRCQKSNDN